MLSLDDTLRSLEFYFKEGFKLREQRLEILNSALPQALKDETDVDLKARIDAVDVKTRRVLSDLTCFPPYHDRYQKSLEEFHKVAPFDKSVFVMTKYPDAKNPGPLDHELQQVIDTVKAAVTASGYTPRLASDREYCANLWENVELHLLGCGKGLAIVEGIYKPELNPNVAMEWGWMRGMGRRVLYLVEQTFTAKRADWGGLIEYSFAWADPAKSVPADVKQWLSGF